MELQAISSIFDDSVGQKRPAPEGYGQIYPSCRQRALLCGRTVSSLFLKLNKFVAYLDEILKWDQTLSPK